MDTLRNTLPGTTAYGGVCALALAAPFELTQPLIGSRWQSISNLEAIVLAAFGSWMTALAWARSTPDWRRPLTTPWLALLAVMVVAAALAPVARMNALHMAGRTGVALGIYLLTVNGVTTLARLHRVLALLIIAGVVVGVLAILEYFRIAVVLQALKAFRPGLSTVGAQIRAGGSLQYPTIASMYLEIVFALGIGLLLAVVDTRDAVKTVVIFAALVVVAEGVTLTLTRAGLATMAVSLATAGVWRRRQRGMDTGVKLMALLAVTIAALFAASRSADSLWLRLTSESQDTWYRSSVEAPADLALTAGADREVPIRVTNLGRLTWDSREDPPFYMSYHWLETGSDRVVAFDGERTAFRSPVEPNTTALVQALVRAPKQAGHYRLAWDVVQEGRLWFSAEPGAAMSFSQATVSGGASNAPQTARSELPRSRVRPGRITLWRAAVRMLAAHPWLGVGPDNFRLLYGEYIGLRNPDRRTHSNNMYLEVLVGTGVVGGLTLAWLTWRLARRVGALARTAATDADRTVFIGIALATLAIGIHGVFDSFLGFTPTYILMALTLGLTAAPAVDVEA